MGKRKAKEMEKLKKDFFKWIVNETHIDTDDTFPICLAPDKAIAEDIALRLSQNEKEYYYYVEEL